MATKSKPETAQSTKPKRATASTSPATDGKRTAGAVTRSTSNVGKTSGAATVPNVPSYLRATQCSRTESPKSGGRKETLATKPSPALTRRQSIDKSSQPAQLQRVLSSAGPRSPTLKSPSAASSSPRAASSRPTELSKSLSSSSRSKPATARPTELAKSLSSSSRSRTATARPAELVKSKTMPKAGATTGKTVKKSPVPGPSTLKRQTGSDSNKQHVTVEAEPQVVVEEEKATQPPPLPPAIVTVEYESVECDGIVVEEDHIEQEEEVVVSTVKEEEAAIIPDIGDSPQDIIDTSEESALKEEEQEVEEEEEEEECNNHDIDEAEIIYSEVDRESPNKETLIKLLPLDEGDEAEVVKSDAAAAADAEEENPIKETIIELQLAEGDEAEVVKSDAAAADAEEENPIKETLIELQPPEEDEAEVLKSDATADAEEENPNKETLIELQSPERNEAEVVKSDAAAEAEEETPNKETLIKLQSPEGNEAEVVVKSDADHAEEETPNKETLINHVEEKGHNDVTVKATASVSQSPQKQPEAAKIGVMSRAAAMNGQRSSVGKKETPAAYNDVIEETKNKLMEKRKNKVLALVGAFETVISLQE